jgi:hypothetical protein
MNYDRIKQKFINSVYSVSSSSSAGSPPIIFLYFVYDAYRVSSCMRI